MLKKIVLGLLAAVVLFALVLAAGTWRQASRQITVAPAPKLTLDENAAAERLAQALRLKTVASRADPKANAEPFTALRSQLAEQFHSVAGALQREVMDDSSLLYTWGGTDPGAAPILLVAHQDVAPASGAAAAPSAPFPAAVKDGVIEGHDVRDGKTDLLAQLQAIDLLIADGYKPRRTVYLAYGADQELGGLRGAARIAELLKQRGIHPACVLGEGLPLLVGVVPGVTQPVALVGVAGAGHESVTITVNAPAGPASPPEAGAGALLDRVLARLRGDPVPPTPNGVASSLIRTLAPEMHGLLRVEASNPWLFRSRVRERLADVPVLGPTLGEPPAAVVQSDSRGSAPGRAQATVDLPVPLGTTREALLERVRKVVAEVVPAGRFELQVLPGAQNPQAVVATDSPQYQALNRTIREVFPHAVVAPAMAAAGDAMYYGAISDHVLRFSPLRANASDLGRAAGASGRLSVADYADAIRFYYRLIPQLTDADSLRSK